MKKTWKRLCTGFLALATVVTALPTTPVHAESKQYCGACQSRSRYGITKNLYGCRCGLVCKSRGYCVEE